ncbi:MAG: hypothetical protein MHPSP_001888, partial [Paramarteilia canceri]
IDPCIAQVKKISAPLPKTVEEVVISVGEEILLHQVINGCLAEVSKKNNASITGFLRYSQLEIVKQTSGIERSEIEDYRSAHYKPLGEIILSVGQYKEKIGDAIKIYDHPVLKIKADEDEINPNFDPEKDKKLDDELPEFLPKLNAEIVAIVSEYYHDDKHIGFGFDPQNRNKSGFFMMQTCFSG